MRGSEDTRECTMELQKGPKWRENGDIKGDRMNGLGE